MEALSKVWMRAAGMPDFEVELELSGTALQAKIAATAGCDIDPQTMRLIYKGRVLKDDDILSTLGLKAGEALHIARGSSASPSATAPSPSISVSTSPAAGGVGPAAPSFRLVIKGPGGVEAELAGLSAKEPIARIRELASKKCGFKPEQVHLLHRARMLRDGSSLAECGVASGDVLRVARRQPQVTAQAAATSSTGQQEALAAEFGGAAGAPMPMAWGGGLALPPGMEEQARMAAQAMGVPLEELLGGLPLQQVAAAAAAAPRPGQPPPGETAAELQARFHREAQEMLDRVRAYLIRERAAATEEPGRRGAGAANPPEQDLDENDPELLADIAGVLSEARSRGAPVPNAAVFVDRCVARRRQSRALQTRLDREASGMEPELEDALAAAEQTAAAAARMPRRLGRGPDAAGTSPPQS